MAEYYGIEPKFVGKNNAANGVSTSAVTANADGTLLERLEYVQTCVGGLSGQLRFQQSASNVVEDDSYANFEITLVDINSGAIASANIDITSITVELAKSTGGGAFSAVGITQPTFSKADGRVYTSNRFLAAEWSVGDTYRLTVSGITVAFGTETAYVPAMVWSNLITDIIDIDTIVDDIKVDTDRLHDTAVTVGMAAGSFASYIAGNNGGLGTQLPASNSLYDTTKNVNTVGITSAPVPNTLSDILHKDGSFTYDNTTDSLEAISGLIAGASGVFHEQADTAVNYTTNDSEDTVLSLATADTRYILRSLYLKFADPGANTITVRLKLLINDVSTTVKSFTVTTANYTTYFSLMDMFAEAQISGDSIIITTQNSAAADVAVTGQYSYAKTNV